MTFLQWHKNIKNWVKMFDRSKQMQPLFLPVADFFADDGAKCNGRSQWAPSIIHRDVIGLLASTIKKPNDLPNQL